MSNLTVTIDDELLREARIRALQQGTSVNAICREAIDAFVRRDASATSAAARARADAFVEHARRVRRPPSPDRAADRLPTRAELYDGVLAERSPRTSKRGA